MRISFPVPVLHRRPNRTFAQSYEVSQKLSIRDIDTQRSAGLNEIIIRSSGWICTSCLFLAKSARLTKTNTKIRQQPASKKTWFGRTSFF